VNSAREKSIKKYVWDSQMFWYPSKAASAQPFSCRSMLTPDSEEEKKLTRMRKNCDDMVLYVVLLIVLLIFLGWALLF